MIFLLYEAINIKIKYDLSRTNEIFDCALGGVYNRYYKNLIENISEKPAVVINTFKDGKHFWGINNDENMTIDAIIGNPPYQIAGGSGGSNDSPVYQKFCFLGLDLKPSYASFIIPSRWFSAGRDVLLGDFRKRMLSCGNIEYLRNVANSKFFFDNVEIKGGVCYFLYNKRYQGDCTYVYSYNDDLAKQNIKLSRFDILIRDPRIADIVEKVYTVMKEEGCLGVDTIMSGDTPFGIPTNVMDSAKNSFKVSMKKTSEYNILVYYLEKNKRKTAYIEKATIRKNVQDIDKYKVLLPKASGSGSDPYVLGETIVTSKNSVCSQTFIYVPFESIEEANNFVSYLKTRFARILIASIKLTQDCLSGVFRFVPILDFTKPWNDFELFDKYKISDNERHFIISTIKEIE